MQEMTPGWLRKNDPSTAAMVEGGEFSASNGCVMKF